MASGQHAAEGGQQDRSNSPGSGILGGNHETLANHRPECIMEAEKGGGSHMADSSKKNGGVGSGGSTVKPDPSPVAPRPSTGGTGPYPPKERRDSSVGGKERKG